jgi:hypothetical protein
MSNINLRNISNDFLDVRLVSLASWRQANEITPRDRGGPYMVLQEGYDPQSLKPVADEFVLGRSGKWLLLSHFFGLPVEERRAEFVFGTAAEVMAMMQNLPSKAVLFGPAVLLIDEMSHGLAPLISQRLLAMVRGLAKQQGTAVMLVEQTVDMALAVSDRAYVMRQGRIVMSGRASELAGARELLEGHYLGQAHEHVVSDTSCSV